MHLHYPAAVFHSQGHPSRRSCRRNQPCGNEATQNSDAGGTQRKSSAGIFRLHLHRRIPPLHLQPVATGDRLFRCQPDWSHRHAGQPHLRLLQEERGQRLQPRKAVADGVNVGNEIYVIETEITQQGAQINAQQQVERPIDTNPGDDKRQQAQQQLVSEAAKVLNGELVELVELIDAIRRDKEQTIDHDNLDSLVRAEWDKDAANNAQALTDEFANYLRSNQDNIAALTIFFSQPYRRRELSFDLIRQVLDKLKSDKPKLAPLRVWQAYRQLDDYKGAQPISELTALVALIRRVCGMDAQPSTFDDTVRRNFQNWVMKHHSGGTEKFNEEQMDWLRMIRDHVANSFHIERDDLEMSPFDGQGGLGKIYQLFGAKMDTLLDELNKVLVA